MVCVSTGGTKRSLSYTKLDERKRRQSAVKVLRFVYGEKNISTRCQLHEFFLLLITY